MAGRVQLRISPDAFDDLDNQRIIPVEGAFKRFPFGACPILALPIAMCTHLVAQGIHIGVIGARFHPGDRANDLREKDFEGTLLPSGQPAVSFAVPVKTPMADPGL